MRTAFNPMGVNMSEIGFPDWGNPQPKIWGTTYQADSDGFIIAGMQGAGGGNADKSTRCYLFIGNDTSTSEQVGFVGGTRGTAASFNSVFIPIKKGNYYRTQNPSNSSSVAQQFITFYPCL